eukprot:TRINITY_DN3706_c0_g1_i1.p1 TRINITY_DN3706_c0_g1~~TRINITY_DN3706_c0_g1_i1.p1  ORF type:complete len:288 (-),score=25.36 TRINITY_DN3706_c0_g1_i1:31-789(-)
MIQDTMCEEKQCNSTAAQKSIVIKNKRDLKPNCFLDGNFSNVVLSRILQQQKVPYGDLCQLSKLSSFYGGFARQQLAYACPRQFNNLEKLKEEFGQQITCLDLSASKQEVTTEILKIIPQFFPNVGIVKFPMTPLDMPEEWQQQNSIQTLLKSTSKIDAQVLMIDCIKICDADGEDFVNEWVLLLKNLLLHLKKQWKSVSMSFRFFRLQSLLLVLREFEDINEEGVFQIRVTVILTMEYIFKQLGTQDQLNQ